MKNRILQTLQRFYGLKLKTGVQTDIHQNGKSLTFSRYKTSIAMLDEDKYAEVETVSQETNSLSWLHKAAPGFPANGSKITVLHEPSVFYSTLINKCRTAKRRITLASLYLGTGELEADLVAAIEENLEKTNGSIKVKVLLDYMRGSRGKHNSRTMLKPLLNNRWSNSCDVSLYHTPKLRGFLKAMIPTRFNELVGLQHMKLYLFDDTLIISGANLSNDYFTNRQDRYIVIEDCKELCDFYDKLVDGVSEFSFKLLPDGTTTFNAQTEFHPYKGSRKNFTVAAAGRIKTLFQEELEKRIETEKNCRLSDSDTWIFPLIEMGQLNIHHDSEITLRLIETAPEGATLKLATGYLNLIPEYRKALLKDCKATCDLLTAHPTANGFFGAKGIAGKIPSAYTKIEESFCRICEKLGQTGRVTLWEFSRPGWTYHAKGLWYSLPGQRRPCLTLIGSPNFGYRSVRKDLETQVALVTRNEGLQDALEKEHARLFSRAKPVNSKSFKQHDRIVPAWTDASDYALGASFFQVNDHGDQGVVAFASRTLKGAEIGYYTTEKELLAIVWALQKFRSYILGTKIFVVTDHKALSFLKTCRLVNSRLARWILLIQEYDLHMVYVSGGANVVADVLSRYLPKVKNIGENEKKNVQIAITLAREQLTNEFTGEERGRFHSSLFKEYYERRREM